MPPAVPGEESERVLRHWRVWSSLQTRGVTGGGEGVVAGSSRVLACNQRVTRWPRRESAYFCRKMPADFGVNVYRKSTGELVSGKSAAKVSRVRTVVPRESNAPRSAWVENALVLHYPGDCVEALRPDAVSLNKDAGGAKRSFNRERQWHSETHGCEAENILGL